MEAREDQPPEEPTAEPHEKRRNWWIWGCAGLAIVVVGLAIWGVGRQKALDDSQQEVATLQSQTEQSKDTGSAVVATFKGAYDALAQQLGATNEDLEATQQDLAAAQDAADKAEQDAATAKEDAAQAEDEVAKAGAQAEEAKAEAEGARSRATIVKDCAKAYVSAIGALFEGDSVSAQASAVRQDLRSISSDCANALGGS
jgi:uncharacterized membrane protein YdfJ with MMPL/SSD domain